jgi:spermidine synthase
MESNVSHSKQRKTIKGPSSILLYAIVALSGLAVMVVELLGTRVIAPFYGASLYVWSALIAVTMVSLAAGYFVGGRLADREQGFLLPYVLLAAGLFTVGVPLESHWVLPLTDSLGLRLGSLVSALLLFAPALTLMGTVCPQAIKLDAQNLSVVGASAGRIYAISTVGSVVGTFAVAFLLFPYLGSREILLGLGSILVITGFLIQLFHRTTGPWSFVLLLGSAVLLWGSWVGLGVTSDGQGFRRLSSKESLYGWVRVLENPANDIRLLASDASVIGASAISSDRSLLGYQEVVTLIPEFIPNVHRVLLVGQGAGHMAMDMKKRHGIVTDAIELDPQVNQAAEAFFGYVSSGKSVVADGRNELRNLKGPYDLIIHDCFTGGTDPSHLLTVETFDLMKTLLRPGGVLALNTVAFFGQGHDPALTAIVRTVDAVFPFHRVYAGEPHEDFNDYVVIASDRPWEDALGRLTEAKSDWLASRLVQVSYQDAAPLTDDFNPLEYLQLAKSEKYRTLVAGWLGSGQMMP